jgi:hypothetical protein
MPKEDFVANAGAPPSMAEKAWEVAEGDEDYASQLLEPHKLWVKGKFMDGGNKFGGLFFFQWNFTEKSVSDCLVMVAGADNMIEIPMDVDTAQYRDRLSLELKTGTKMGGNTEILQEALSGELTEPDSDLRSCIEAGDLAELESYIEEILVSSLDVRSPVITLQPVVTRKVEEMAEPSTDAAVEEEEEEERFEIPCEVEINPVKGVPLARIQIGDLIYVDLGDVSGENVKFVKPLNKRRDESGLIPSRLVARETTEAGTMKLTVQFARGVYGVARTSKDISLLVPPETVSVRAFKRNGTNPVEFLEQNWIIILAALIAITIVLIAYTFI